MTNRNAKSRNRPRLYVWAMRGLLTTTVVLLALLCWGTWRRDTPVVVQSSLTPQDSVRLGEPLVYTFELDLPPTLWPLDLELECPETLQTLDSPHLEILCPGWGTYRVRGTVPLQPLKTGTVDPIAVTATSRSLLFPRRVELHTQVPAFNVVPWPRDDNSPRLAPELGPAEAGDGTHKNPWYPLLIAAIVLLILALLLKRTLARRSASPFIAPQPPAHETALDRIEQLADALPMQPEPFFVQLTDIVRAYVEQQLHIDAQQLTTPEFLRSHELADSITPNQRKQLDAFLSEADQIKFAQQNATVAQCREALDTARRFVLETRPPPPSTQSAQS